MKLGWLIFLCTAYSLHAQQFDVSDHDFNSTESVPLAGKWDFYWDTLFVPDQFTQLPHETVSVPHHWVNPISSYGKATYYARIALGSSSTSRAMQIPYVRCAARVFVNGKVAGKLGDVGDESTSYQSQLGSLLVTLPDSGTVNLVIQVANYENYGAGLAATPIVGHPNTLHQATILKKGIDMVFVGCLLAMGIYLITMYFLYHEGYAFLFLALICFVVVFRSLTTESSSLLLPTLFPETGWALWKKIEFTCVYSVVALMPLYVGHMFKKESIRKIEYTFLGVASILCLFVLFTPHNLFAKLLDVAHVSLLAGFAYAIVIIRKAFRNKNPDASIILIGFLTAFPFIFLEILKNSILQVPIKLTHLTEMGVLSFLMFQVYVLANHYATTYRNLSIEVDKRTSQLAQSNEINSRMLAILSHDVRGPLNSLKGIVHLFNLGLLTDEEFKSSTKQIEAQSGKTIFLVENILMWAKSQISGISLTMEKLDLNLLVMAHIDLYKVQADLNNVSIRGELFEIPFVMADNQVISMVLRNLISNAIKYSRKNTAIIIRTRESHGKLLLQVSNIGVGMPAAQVTALFQNTSNMISKDSTGIGLKLCRAYLLAMETDFEIVSIPNRETTITIPLQFVNS